MTVVADASPLIALARIEQLDILREIFGHLIIPGAVWRELVDLGKDKAGANSIVNATWIERRDLLDTTLATALMQYLGAGESEAIALAKESGADFLLIDERLGRSAARRLGIQIVGLVGVLVEARQRGLVVNPQHLVRDLHEKAGFWLSADLRKLILGDTR